MGKSLKDRHAECDAAWQKALGADDPEEGFVVACSECGADVVVLGDGIVVDDESGVEHECNPEDEG